jgi:hypothetical protein
MKIIGYYNHYGYRIEDNENGKVLYEAGNNPLESTGVVERKDGISIEMIKMYCEQSGRDIAEEKGVEWLGAHQDEDEEEETEHILESNIPTHV